MKKICPPNIYAAISLDDMYLKPHLRFHLIIQIFEYLDLMTKLWGSVVVRWIDGAEIGTPSFVFVVGTTTFWKGLHIQRFWSCPTLSKESNFEAWISSWSNVNTAAGEGNLSPRSFLGSSLPCTSSLTFPQPSPPPSLLRSPLELVLLLPSLLCILLTVCQSKLIKTSFWYVCSKKCSIWITYKLRNMLFWNGK